MPLRGRERLGLRMKWDVNWGPVQIPSESTPPDQSVGWVDMVVSFDRVVWGKARVGTRVLTFENRVGLLADVLEELDDGYQADG